jgi:hypothetical protein
VAGRADDALAHFETARHYPENLGEGKHLLTLERDLDYFSGLAAKAMRDAERARRYWNAAAAPLAVLGVHSYFQVLALRELGDEPAARAALSRLAEFADQQMMAEPKIDYFATSLPNLLLFEDDLGKRNRVESLLLRALATHGLGDAPAAVHRLEQALAEDPNHQFAAEMLSWLQIKAKKAPEKLEVYPAS